MPWHGQHQILADQLSLFQPEGADFAHHITNETPGFSDLKFKKKNPICPIDYTTNCRACDRALMLGTIPYMMLDKSERTCAITLN